MKYKLHHTDVLGRTHFIADTATDHDIAALLHYNGRDRVKEIETTTDGTVVIDITLDGTYRFTPVQQQQQKHRHIDMNDFSKETVINDIRNMLEEPAVAAEIRDEELYAIIQILADVGVRTITRHFTEEGE